MQRITGRFARIATLACVTVGLIGITGCGGDDIESGLNKTANGIERSGGSIEGPEVPIAPGVGAKPFVGGDINPRRGRVRAWIGIDAGRS
jgi:hypothetical protein